MRTLSNIVLPAIFLVVVLACCESAVVAEDSVAVTFYAMGDTPYTPEDDVLLPKQIAALPSDAEFVVHLGDIKDGTTPCDEAVYMKVSGMLRKSAHRVFIVPGDNEWNDCVDPVPSWEFWKKYFMRFDRHWKNDITVVRHAVRNENFGFLHGGVLFIGINIVGGRVQDAAEWDKRHQQNVAWVDDLVKNYGPNSRSLVLLGHATPTTKHAKFFGPFGEIATRYEKPVLYIHGDGHRWIKDRPFEQKNILRVQVDQGGIASPVKVVVGTDMAEPFTFERRK
jgi:hypothetical protein